METVLTIAEEKLVREFADEFTTQYSQGDPKYVNHQAQSDAVVEIVKQYVQALSSDRAEKWRAWAKLTDEEVEEQTSGGSLFEYDEQLATDRDKLAFKLLEIMWAADKPTWQWITNIQHVDFGDDTFEKACDLENVFKVLFASHP